MSSWESGVVVDWTLDPALKAARDDIEFLSRNNIESLSRDDISFSAGITGWRYVELTAAHPRLPSENIYTAQ